MKRYLFLLFAASSCYHPNSTNDPLVTIQIQDRNGLTETINNSDRLEIYQGTDFLSSQPYKKVLRVFRKDRKTHSKITTYHANGLVWQYLEAEEMRAHGAYREWYSNGQLKIEAQVIGGTADVSSGSQKDWLFDGISQVWDDQGRLVAKIPYEKGVLEGQSRYFYPSGQIEKDLPYKKNILEGESLEYLPSGKLKSTTRFQRGIKEGLSIGYFENGQISWNEEYSDGLLRTGTYYDSKGNLISAVEKGGGFQALFENELLSFMIEFRCGRPEGLVKKFSSTGELEKLYHLKNGKKQGEEIEFFSNLNREKPLKKLSIHWNENMIHGSVKTWYDNGKLESQREFCRNQKMGPALAWYRDGSIMLIEEYEEELLIKGQYYKMNQKESVSSISNGNGIATLYDDSGIFLHKIPYFKGKPLDSEE